MSMGIAVAVDCQATIDDTTSNPTTNPMCGSLTSIPSQSSWPADTIGNYCNLGTLIGTGIDTV